MGKIFLTSFYTLIFTGSALASEDGGHQGSTLLPFVFHWINFLIVAFLIYKYALPKIKNFFIERSQRIGRAMREAEKVKIQAEEKLHEYEEKARYLHEEIEKLTNIAHQEALENEKKIISSAEKEAERIQQQTKKIIEQELKKAKLELKMEAANLSLEKARIFVQKNLTDKDQAKLISDYMNQIS